MTKRIEELVKSEDALSDQVELLEKENQSTSRRIRELEEEVVELNANLQQEKNEYRELKKRYVAEVKDNESKTSLLNSRLDDMRKLLQKAVEERESMTEEHRIKIGILNRDKDLLLSEKEQMKTDNQNIIEALKMSARSIQKVMKDIEDEGRHTMNKIEAHGRNTDLLTNELQRLSTHLDEVLAEANEKLKASEERLIEQQKLAAEATKAHEREIEDMHEKMRHHLKIIEEQVAETKELQREVEALHRDGERDRERIKQLKNDLQQAKENAGKYKEEDLLKAREEEKKIWKDKLTELQLEHSQLNREMNGVKMDLANKVKIIGTLEEKKQEVETQLAKVTEEKEAEREALTQQLEEVTVDAEKKTQAMSEELQFALNKIKELKEVLEGKDKELTEEKDKINELADRFPNVARYLNGEEIIEDEEDDEEADADVNEEGADEVSIHKRSRNPSQQSQQSQRSRNSQQSLQHSVRSQASQRSRKSSQHSNKYGDNDVPAPGVVRQGSLQSMSSISSKGSRNEDDLDEDDGSFHNDDGFYNEDGELYAANMCIQTDPMTLESMVPPLQEVQWNFDYNKVEDLVREGIITNNYFYDKNTNTFSNAYPVDESFMKELIHSFYNMSTNIVALANDARRMGYKNACRQNVLYGSIPTEIEKFLLNTAKDLVIKLEKSKEDIVVKLRSEHAEQMQERVQETVEQLTTQHHNDVFELQMKHNAEKEALEKKLNSKLKKLQTKISDQDIMYKEAEEKLKNEFELELKKQKDILLEAMSEEKDDDQLILPPDLSKPGGADLASDLQKLYLRKSTMKNQNKVDLEQLKESIRVQLKVEVEDEIKKEVYHDFLEREKKYEDILHFDQMDSEEGKSLLQLLFDISPNDPNFLQKVSELDPTKLDLTKLSFIGEVRNENFDRLKGKIFGTEEIVQLTNVEYHMRYNTKADSDPFDAYGQEAAAEVKTDAGKDRQYRMQVRSLEIKRNILLNKIVSNTPILQLVSFLHATEQHLIKLSSIETWRQLAYYQFGGVFRDILNVHIDVLKLCIKNAGGAAAINKALLTLPVDTDLNQYPEDIRIKALEIFRRELNNDSGNKEKVVACMMKVMRESRIDNVMEKLQKLTFDSTTGGDTEANNKRNRDMVLQTAQKALNMVSKDPNFVVSFADTRQVGNATGTNSSSSASNTNPSFQQKGSMVGVTSGQVQPTVSHRNAVVMNPSMLSQLFNYQQGLQMVSPNQASLYPTQGMVDVNIGTQSQANIGSNTAVGNNLMMQSYAGLPSTLTPFPISALAAFDKLAGLSGFTENITANTTKATQDGTAPAVAATSNAAVVPMPISALPLMNIQMPSPEEFEQYTPEQKQQVQQVQQLQQMQQIYLAQQQGLVPMPIQSNMLLAPDANADLVANQPVLSGIANQPILLANLVANQSMLFVDPSAMQQYYYTPQTFPQLPIPGGSASMLGLPPPNSSVPGTTENLPNSPISKSKLPSQRVKAGGLSTELPTVQSQPIPPPDMTDVNPQESLSLTLDTLPNSGAPVIVNSNRTKTTPKSIQITFKRPANKLAADKEQVGDNAVLNQLADTVTNYDTSVSNTENHSNKTEAFEPNYHLHNQVDRIIFAALRGYDPGLKYLELLQKAFHLWSNYQHNPAYAMLTELYQNTVFSEYNSITYSVIDLVVRGNMNKECFEVYSKIKNIVDYIEHFKPQEVLAYVIGQKKKPDGRPVVSLCDDSFDLFVLLI
jgi:hypothetical protein